ncbi:MAG: hypothetical protein ACK41E_02945 [Deinococcales bacterium]
MRVFWLFVVLLFPASVLAAPACDPESPSITSIEGVGTIYSSADSSDGNKATFLNACLEQDGWVIRAPLLLVQGVATGVLVSADNATLEREGAKGTINRLELRSQIVYLEGLALELLPSYKISGFSQGRYTITAARGQLHGSKLTLQNADFVRLDGAGKALERYLVSSAVLENQNVTINQLVFGSPFLGISAQAASSSNAGIALGAVTGLVGRNSAGSEISFTASEALRLENGVYRLENTTFSLFGLPIFVGRYDYDPRCPFELPVVFGVGNGLTFGLENLLLSCDGKTRGTFAVYNLFGKTPTNSSATALALTLGYIDGASQYFVGQAKGDTLRASVQHEPLSGFTSAFAFVSGSRLESSVQGLRSVEGRVGAAYQLSLDALTLRPKLELGTISESQGNTLRDYHGFVRGNINAGLAWSRDQFTLSGSFDSRLTYYFGDVYNGFHLDYTAKLGANISVPYFNFSLNFVHAEQPVAAPFATHILAPNTTLTGNLRIAPTLPSLPLGYSGISLEQPYFGMQLIYDLRNDTFSTQSINFGATLALYDGSTTTDHLGTPFQTPLLSITPRAEYNFIPQKGSVGASLTYFGQSLAYTLNVEMLIPSYEFKIGFGIRLR